MGRIKLFIKADSETELHLRNSILVEAQRMRDYSDELKSWSKQIKDPQKVALFKEKADLGQVLANNLEKIATKTTRELKLLVLAYQGEESKKQYEEQKRFDKERIEAWKRQNGKG